MISETMKTVNPAHRFQHSSKIVIVATKIVHRPPHRCLQCNDRRRFLLIKKAYFKTAMSRCAFPHAQANHSVAKQNFHPLQHTREELPQTFLDPAKQLCALETLIFNALDMTKFCLFRNTSFCTYTLTQIFKDT